jgi:glycosyltransferase involved in cell wall biosynthesis
MKKRVLIIGPILTQSGYGEHARLVYRALKHREDLFDIFIKPIKWGETSWLWEDNEERHELDNLIQKTLSYEAHFGQNAAYDLAFLVTIPGEWQQYQIKNCYNVGVTAVVESSKVSKHWIEQGNNFVDKIVVTSEFSKGVYENSFYTEPQGLVKLQKEAEVVNYPVKEYKLIKNMFELDYDFNFLCVAQWSTRKNIENTVKWFIEEFYDQEVGLVLKTSRMKNCSMDRTLVKKQIRSLLAQYPKRKCKLYFIHGYMNEDEMHSMYCQPKIKALISFTHGEGYGLPIFEAAYCGLPIITHDWGGQTDFLYVQNKDKKGKIKRKKMYTKVQYDLKPIQKEAVWKGVLEEDSMWAYPRPGDCKMKMREVYKDYSRIKSQAKKLQKEILKNFTPEKIYESFMAALGEEHVQALDEEVEAMFNEIAI